MKYWSAMEEIEPISNELIEQHHPHLMTVKIAFLFKQKASKKGGKLVLATASRFPEKYQCLFPSTGPEDPNSNEDPPEFAFLIEVACDQWNLATRTQRVALIDHELCHCMAEEDPETEEMIYSIVGHDFEEFESIVRRHGCWKEDLLGARSCFAAARLTKLDEIATELSGKGGAGK